MSHSKDGNKCIQMRPIIFLHAPDINIFDDLSLSVSTQAIVWYTIKHSLGLNQNNNAFYITHTFSKKIQLLKKTHILC